MNGYIKVLRAIREHWIWHYPKRLRAWLYLLMEAAWEPKTIPWGKEETLTLQRGQLASTIRVLAGQFEYAPETTIKFLNMLENHGMIKRDSSSKMTVITIVNWDKYQDILEEAEQKPKRKSKHTKEDKNKEIINNNSLSLSREKEIEILTELGKEEYLQQRAELFHLSLDLVKMHYTKFFERMKRGTKTHKDEVDLRNHFDNLLAQVVERGGAKKINLNNGTGQGQAPTQDKYAPRRGTDAGNHTPDDYSGSF